MYHASYTLLLTYNRYPRKSRKKLAEMFSKKQLMACVKKAVSL